MGEWTWSKKFTGVGHRKNSSGQKTFYIRYRTPDGRRVMEAKPRGLPEVLVWSTRSGRTYRDPPMTLRRAMERLFNRGVEDGRQRVSFHTLRHSFISHLVMRGVPLPVIQSLTGHKTLEMLQRYTHLAPDARWAAVESLAGENRPTESPEIERFGGGSLPYPLPRRNRA